MGIIYKIKKNKFFNMIVRTIMAPKFMFDNFMFDSKAKKRANGFIDERYIGLKKLQNTANVKRCFIVGTGPSLTKKDLLLLKNEKTFCLNSGVKLIDDNIWIPDYYVIQDKESFKLLEKEIISKNEKYFHGNVFIGSSIPLKNYSHFKHYEYPLNILDHKRYHKKGFGKFKYSGDIYREIDDFYTVAISAVQIAIYMGFKEIYLVGCDCNYKLDKKYSVEYGRKDPYIEVLGDRFIYSYHQLNNFISSVDVEIYNATRGGMLEVFPRKNIEDVVNEEK